MKRFLTVILALIFVLSLGLAGCNDAPQTPVTPPSTENGDGDGDGSDEDPPAPPEEEPMTFADFLETKMATGKTFFTEHIRSAVTQAAVLAETVNFVAEEDDTELEQISYAYIYKAEGTARKYDVVNLTLPTPVSFDDIASGKAGDMTPTVQTVLSFGFDAKEFVDRAELCDALAYRIEKYTTIGTNASKYFGTVERTESGVDQILTYPVLFEDNGKFFVDSISIYDRNFDDAKLIENLRDQTEYDKMRCGAGFNEERNLGTLRGENVYTSEYKAEFEKENPGPVTPGTEEKIESVEDLVTNYPTELNQGLQGAYDHIVEKIFPYNLDSNYNENKLYETKWNFETDQNGNISKINYYGKYKTSETKGIFFITSIDCSQNHLELKDLTNKNIVTTLQNFIKNSNPAYKFESSFGYDLTPISGLAEAVFEKAGLKEENATYYVSSLWGSSEDGTLGSYRNTDILQITTTGIKKVTVKISDDGDLVNNVKNGKCTISNQTSYEFGEYTINAETNMVAKTSFSLYNEDMA